MPRSPWGLTCLVLPGQLLWNMRQVLCCEQSSILGHSRPLAWGEKTHTCMRKSNSHTGERGKASRSAALILASTIQLLHLNLVCQKPNMNVLACGLLQIQGAIRTNSNNLPTRWSWALQFLSPCHPQQYCLRMSSMNPQDALRGTETPWSNSHCYSRETHPL